MGNHDKIDLGKAYRFLFYPSSMAEEMLRDIEFGEADPRTMHEMDGHSDFELTFSEYLAYKGIESGGPLAEKVYRPKFEELARNVKIISGEIVSRYQNPLSANDQTSSKVCQKVLDNSASDDLFAGGIFFCRGDSFKKALELRSDFLKRMSFKDAELMLRYIPDEDQMTVMGHLLNSEHSNVATYASRQYENGHSSGSCSVSF